MKIFLDVDGVLIDGWHADPARRKPWDATIEQDLGVRREVFQALFFGRRDGGRPSLMHECVSGAMDLKAALADVLPKAGYGGAVDEFVDYWFAKDSNVNRDVLETVQRLSVHDDVVLYLATGQDHYRADYLWHQLALKDFFADIFYSARLGHPKNATAFFETVNASLAIGETERPLFFDDQPDIVEVANRAGWDACVFETVADMRDHPRLRALLA